MIATAEYAQHVRTIPPRTEEPRERCAEQFADAEKELGAFVKAFGELFGARAAADAAECWVELVESATYSGVAGSGHWRQISVTAASQKATRYGLKRVEQP